MKTKRLKLRSEVKLVMMLLLISICFLITNIQYEKAVDTCVKAGHEVNHCREGLR